MPFFVLPHIPSVEVWVSVRHFTALPRTLEVVAPHIPCVETLRVRLVATDIQSDGTGLLPDDEIIVAAVRRVDMRLRSLELVSDADVQLKHAALIALDECLWEDGWKELAELSSPGNVTVFRERYFDLDMWYIPSQRPQGGGGGRRRILLG